MGFLVFKGGIHPPDKKSLSSDKPVAEAKQPDFVVIPLSQHIGAPCKPVVSIGQEVKKGEMVGEATGFVSSPVHSSVSGKVTAISDSPNAMGRMVSSSCHRKQWQGGVDIAEGPSRLYLSPEQLKEMVKDAGLVGMGGAAFPTHVKLSPPKEKPIDVLIINGAECEPYLTADYRLMIERPSDIVEGTKVLMKILGVKKAFIGIEDNKPDAIDILKKAASGTDITVCGLEVKYPQGAEKMLIKAAVNREVPPARFRWMSASWYRISGQR